MHKRAMELVINYGNHEEVIFECAIRILDPLFNQKIHFKKINFFFAVLQELRRLNDRLPLDILDWICVPTEKRLQQTDILLKLIKDNFIPVPHLDNKFFEALETSNNNPAVYWSITRIVKVLIFDEKLLDKTHFQKTIDAILKNIKSFKDVYPKMGKYLDDFKNALASSTSLNNQARPKLSSNKDSFYLNALQKAVILFNEKESDTYDQAFNKLEEWMNIGSETEMPNFIKILDSTMFQSDETLIKFFAFTTDICVEYALDSIRKMEPYGKLFHSQAMDFSYIDSFTKLIILILKTIINTNKNEMLEKILHSIVIILTKNHDVHRESFNQRPFFRLFFNLIFDIRRREYNFTQQEIGQFLIIFMKVFDQIQPLKYPGFAFAWLELVSNRNFMPLILSNTTNKVENWQLYCGLMIDLFRFFKETFEGEIYKTEFYKQFYRGTLRALLVMLHDFPEFLIEASFILVENLPEKFHQVRNIIFSAFPKTMQPPDPFRVTEQIEAREEFRVLPNSLYNFEDRITNIKLHEELVRYLSTVNKGDVSDVYFRNICSKLLTKGENDEIAINYPVINAFVLFIPWMIFKNSSDYQQIIDWKAASYELFLKLLTSSNYLMKEALLNAIMNQIRYPNLITFYFTSLIFYIFSNRSDDNLQEQIIKIFIERLIVDRPHPWGVMFAFIELIKEKDIFRKKYFFKNTEFEEMIKYVFKVMGKGDGGEN